MRRALTIATFCLAVAALPVQAQIHGTPPSVTSLGRAGFGRPTFFGNGVVLNRGVVFGQNPRFHVFSGNTFFFHHGFFFRHSFFFPEPFFVPVFGGASYPIIIQTAPQVSNYREERELAREIARLREEVERLREEQDLRDEQRLRESESRKQAPVGDAPLTTLAFRDGHQLVIRNYAIVGQTLWAFSEKQARKTLLSDLDLDATAKLNEERGVEFRVPNRTKPK